MPIKHEISQILDGIYDAALDSKCWPAAISAAARSLNFTSGIIFQQERPSGSVNFVEFYGIEASAIKAYQDHYASRSVWMPLACGLSNSLFVPSEHVPPNQLKRTEFYADWLSHVGIDDAIGGFVRRSDAAITMFTFARGGGPGGGPGKQGFPPLV